MIRQRMLETIFARTCTLGSAHVGGVQHGRSSLNSRKEVKGVPSVDIDKRVLATQRHQPTGDDDEQMGGVSKP